MLGHQASPVAAIRIDGISIVVRLAGTEGQAQLPEQIAS